MKRQSSVHHSLFIEAVEVKEAILDWVRRYATDLPEDVSLTPVGAGDVVISWIAKTDKSGK